MFAEGLVRCLCLEPLELFGGGSLEARKDRVWEAGAFGIGPRDDGLGHAGSGIEQRLEGWRYLAIGDNGDDAQAMPGGRFDLEAHIIALAG
jgi:hypothetical protein